MTSAPSINCHISLISPEPLSDDIYKSWYKIAKINAPYGVVRTITMTDDNGCPQSVGLIQRETNNGHFYVIPLTRDITEKEAEIIIEAFSKKFPDMDFEIEASVIPAYGLESYKPEISVDQQEYADLAIAFAKKQHTDWMNERVSQGWRYGPMMSVKQKMHPLLRPWEQLPKQYQNVDFDQPQKLLDLLNQNGYAVVAKDDLDAVMRVLRKM